MFRPSPSLYFSALLVASFAVLTGRASAWTPKAGPLMTRWARDIDPAHPLPDYPRPQMVRADWLSLNGEWQYQPGEAADAAPVGKDLAGTILVPFPVESALSGVMEHHERLWYRRNFDVPAGWRGQRVLLHFDAVDYETEVFVNGRSLGVHKGGYDAFSFDVTDALKRDGAQEVVVRVFDPTQAAGQPRGKQTTDPTGIMYTPTTGIWQSVWLEPVPAASIESLHLVPDFDGGAVEATVGIAGTAADGARVSVVVKDGERVVGRQEGRPGTALRIAVPNAKPWSPESPFLYDLEISLGTPGQSGDAVTSYFAMRKISLGDDRGVRKLFLNNQAVFQFGPLDQGFWPDGIYTAPTDAALKSDIEAMKAMGFNMVRKHYKVEPQRWYTWCDRLGLLVWQDMPSANSYLPRDAARPPVDAPEFRAELERMVESHWNHPCIVMWVPFNESQGQHDTRQIVELLRKLDPSRLVNEASGGETKGFGDVWDVHNYPEPICPDPHPDQALVCGEYGGIGLKVPGHMWAQKGAGYTEGSSALELISVYAEYAGTVKKFRDERGLSAVIYTQLTDVETETNGLLTYDRLPKVRPDLVAKATRFEIPAPTYRPIAPTSEAEGQKWRYVTDKPAHEWSFREFDDSQWQEGVGGFGNAAGTEGRTSWKTSDIWLRRHFNPGALTPEAIARIVVRDFHDDDVQVYLNGEIAYDRHGFTQKYEVRSLRDKAKATIISDGDNVLAVHCQQMKGGQFIDAGLYERVPPAGLNP